MLGFGQVTVLALASYSEIPVRYLLMVKISYLAFLFRLQQL